jgi:hypothetical protein
MGNITGPDRITFNACDESRIRSIQEIARSDFVDGRGVGI